ncbi:MAG: hypothetical protein HQK84_11825 [Nitrospinae bacterium]|nr:hypothetical protein [Nitrospinota bacterium]
MLVLPFRRDVLMTFMPQQAIVAEIGVSEGGFSKCIFEKTKPKQLHLITPRI